MNNFSKKIDTMVFNILNEEIEKKSNEIVNILEKELKGGQKKLDVATPKGKLTAADFKKLRSSKKTETNEGSKMCENCGGGMYEGQCNECGGSNMGEQNQMNEYGNTSPSDNDMDEYLHRYEIDKLREKQRAHTKDGYEGLESDMNGDEKPSFMSRLKNKLGYGKDKEIDEEEEVEEGNAFSGALSKARKQNKDSFEVDGETYPVREAKENWIQKAKMNKGALHKKLGIRKSVV